MNMSANKDRGPYIGRRAFAFEDQEVFYGRDQEIEELRDLWRGHPLVVLHGLAGSGKTSLLQAGVGPLLAKDGDVLPLGRPLVASSFPEPLLAEHNPYALAVLTSWSPAESRTLLAHESVSDFLRRRARTYKPWRADSLLLVAIDQIEEIFSYERSGPDRDDFFTDLAAAMRDVPDLRVLLATRTDTLSKLAPYTKQLSPNGVVHFRLESLTTQSAVEAVRRPMERAGVNFGPGAAEYVVDKLSEPPDSGAVRATSDVALVIQPVQLQVVCTELWHVREDDQPTINLSFVQDKIDVGLILASFCANIVLEVSERYRTTCRQVLDWLTQGFIAEDGTLVRVSEINPADGIPSKVLRALENEHVLTAYWVSGTKQYQLVNGHLAAAIRHLSRSPVFSHQAELNTNARMQIAESALASRDFALAQYHAKKALETVNPTELRFQADALSLLGNITYLAGQPDVAEKHYRLAAELRDQLGDQPEVGRLFGAIGRIHIHQRNYVRALEDLQLAVTRLPSDLALQTEFATALWLADQSQAAAAVFGAVLFVEPDSADALAGRGQIRAEQGNAAAALDDLQTLQRLRPSVSQEPEVRSAYALALALAGRSETAMAEANTALASTHDSAVILLRAARVALVAGAVDRARELLRMAEGATRPALSSHQRAQVRRILAEASGFKSAKNR